MMKMKKHTCTRPFHWKRSIRKKIAGGEGERAEQKQCVFDAMVWVGDGKSGAGGVCV